MVEVFTASVQKLDPDDPAWQKKISATRWDESRQLKKKLARAQAIGAEYLLNQALRKWMPAASFPVQTIRNADGKKFLPGNPWHFNLSHSGERIACILANVPVGIDIQQNQKHNIRLAQRFFTDAEIQHLAQTPPQDQRQLFMEMWVLKESYVKMTGKGLAHLRQQGEVTLTGNIAIHDPTNPSPRSFWLWENDIPGYCMAACVAAEPMPHVHCHFLPDDWFQKNAI